MDRNAMIDTLRACTGLEDIEECRQIMENHAWDLEAAVNSVLNVMHPPAEDIECELVRNVITFDVLYRELRSKIKLDDTETLATLKQMIESTLNIPACDQDIEGLDGYADSTDLKDIFHSNPVSLVVRLRPERSSNNVNAAPLRLNFIVRNFSNGGNRTSHDRQHRLQIPSFATIQDAKDELAQRCGVPANRQMWIDHSNVPDNASIRSILHDGDTVLVHSIGTPLDRNDMSTRTVFSQQTEDTVSLTSDDSNDDIAIMDDSPVADVYDMAIAKRETLLPNHCEDEMTGIEQFVRIFAARYGPSMPAMYIGSLESAVDDSLNLPVEERRLLAIYLHNDRSVCANVFCQQVLMNDCIVAFLMNHYLMWPWDFTFPSNRRRFLDKSFRLFGPHITSVIENYDQENFPIMLILTRVRSSIESIGFIRGSESFDEVMTKLSSYSEQFETTRTEEINQENERRHRNLIRKEQDEAYHNSLAKDKEKQLRREIEQKMQEKEEQERLAAELAKETMKRKMEEELPEEPAADAKDVCVVRFRLPSGDILSRNFLRSDRLKVIFTYVASKGYPITEYKLLRAYPRKDISQENDGISICDVGLHGRELLTLERR